MQRLRDVLAAHRVGDHARAPGLRDISADRRLELELTTIDRGALEDDFLEQQVAKELARRDLVDFASLMDDDYIPYAHSRVIFDHLEALERRDIDRVILTMPTQHGKSYHTSERFPAWYLGRHPRKNVIIASFGQTRADEASRRTRGLVLDHRYPFENVRVDQRSSAVDLWTLQNGGQVKSAGVNSGLGGFGAHLLILDDPHKDAAEAESITVSDATWTWFQQVFMRRQRKDACFPIPTTRWNDYDVVGRILNTPDGKRWTVLNLPGIADPLIENANPDPLGRAPDEVLWPEGPALPSVETGEITSRAYAAMVQGNPTPKQGSTFKREWFGRRYTAATLPTMSATTIAVDGAWKEGVNNSRSAIALWGTDGIDFYVLNARFGQPEYPVLKRTLIDFWYAHPGADEIAVEDAASGTPLIQELRTTTNLPIIAIPAKGTKEARAEAASAYFEARRIVLPADAPWVHEWIEEHIRFPNKPNDLVDTSGIAPTRLSESYTYIGSA